MIDHLYYRHIWVELLPLQLKQCILCLKLAEIKYVTEWPKTPGGRWTEQGTY